MAAAKKAMQSIDRAMERSIVRAALKDLREQILAGRGERCGRKAGERVALGEHAGVASDICFVMF